MAKLCIDLVDKKTEDENNQREDTKREILYVQNNVPKALKSDNENEHIDVEGDVIKTELKVENNPECKGINEILNVGKTAKSVEIKSENEEHHFEIEKNQISFSKKKSQVF